MTTKATKVRSLFLAALMVFSVFAGTVALSGSAVAEHGSTEVTDLEDNSTYWQGQQLFYDGETDTTYQVRDNETGQLVREVQSDDDGHVVLDSGELDAGQYDLKKEGASSNVVENFEIVEQELEASFEDDEVENNDNGTLEIDSNRGDFNVSISAEHEGDEVDDDVLDQLFNETGAAPADDGEIVVATTSDGEINANFTGVDSGNYTFTVEVTDTTASDTANISVTDAEDGNVEFGDSTYEVPQGGVSDVTINFDGDSTKATVIVGNTTDSGYQANISVTDGDGDGKVVLEFNTYEAGNSDDSALVDTADSEDSASVISGNNDLDNILEQGDYDLSVALGANAVSEATNDPEDVGTLYVNERSTGDIKVWTAPGSESDPFDATLTEDSSIAQDDWAVMQFSATGLDGLLADSDFESVVEGDNGVSLTIEQTEESTKKNSNPKTLSNSSSSVKYWADSDNDTYYVAIDTSDSKFDEGDAFMGTITIDDERLVDDDEESINGTFEIVESEVSIDEPVEVAASENQSISGTSTMAPGSTFKVQIESTGDTQPRFFESKTATVKADGTWSVSFDRFSEQSEGDTFEVSVMGGAATADGSVGAATTTTTNATTTGNGTTMTGTGTDTAGTDTAGTDTPTDDGTDTNGTDNASETTSESESPGFGVAVALVALVAAALLAVRRD